MSTSMECRASARLELSTRALPKAEWESRFLTTVPLTLLAVAALVLAVVAQGEPLAGEAPTIGGVSSEEALRLRALGYADYSPELANLDKSGVSHLDTLAAAPGYTLVVSSIECAARLIDLSGRELHSWKQEECVRWWSAELMRNGDLVVNGGAKKPVDRFAARIGWAGELIWMRDIRAHHQLDWTPANEVLVLTESPRSMEDVGRLAANLVSGVDEAENLVFHDNALAWLGADGKVREVLSLFDAVTAGPLDFGFVPRAELLETPTHVGLFHANSAYAMDQPQLVGTDPLFSEENVLVTSRNQNRIFVVDRRNRSLVWEWGREELQAPHNATWLANGHILVFDNGVERQNSRVLEVDPKTRRVVWKYPDGSGAEFYCPTRGLAQRLANGNTLITNSQVGEAFEVTPAGTMVWQYFTPVLSEAKHRPVLMSLRRYPESWVEPLRGSPTTNR